MLQKLGVKIALITIMLIALSCSSLKITKEDNFSIIGISAKSSGLGASGYGILIEMEEVNSRKTYKSKSLSPMSPHSVIQNVPSGKYIVTRVSVPVGNILYSNWSDTVKTFFGEIIIENSKKYYLGDFTGKRKVGKTNVLTLKLKNQNIPDAFRNKIENENTGWQNGDFIKLFPYDKEELLIY